MNDGRQLGLHYVDAGFPYAVNENFVDFFQGFTHVPVNYAFAGSMPDQVFLSPCFFVWFKFWVKYHILSVGELCGFFTIFDIVGICG